MLKASKNPSLSLHNILGKHLTSKTEGSRVCLKVWLCGCTDVLLAPGCPPISSPNEIRNRGLKVTASLSTSSFVRLQPVIQTLLFLWLLLYDLWFLLPERTLQMYTADRCHTVSEGAEGMCCYGPLAQEKAESTADKPSTTVNVHGFTIFRDRQDTLSLCAQQLFA